jgi:HK97 family phage portal protein
MSDQQQPWFQICSPVFVPASMTGTGSRSAENPAVPLSSASFDDDFWEAMGAGRTTSGVRVTRTKALGYSAVWRAVSLISNKLGALPFKVFRAVGQGKEIDRKHPAYPLLFRRPNEYMGPMIFKQTLQSHALLRGNGYGYIYRDADARPLEILPLNPEVTWPVRRGGKLWYVTEVPSGDVRDEDGKRELRRLPHTDVIHLRGLGFDGLVGYDVIKILRETLGKAIATREHGSRFFSNNARPSLALEFPAGMKDAVVDAVASRWGRMNQGLENSHKIGILREGVKITPFSVNARDSQLTENLTFDAVDIANVFGLPPRKVGLDQGGGYNSLFEENQSVHDDTLDPWIAKWEEECDAKLLTKQEQDGETQECRFVRNAIMRSNPDQRAAFYEKLIRIGALSPDEARALEDMNPLPGGIGQKYFIQSGVTPLDAPIAEPSPAKPASEGDAARAWLTDAAVRMARRLAKAAERKSDLAEHAGVIAEAMDAPLQHLRGGEPGKAPEIARKLTDFAAKQADFGQEYEQKCVEIVLKTAFSEPENA